MRRNKYKVINYNSNRNMKVYFIHITFYIACNGKLLRVAIA